MSQLSPAAALQTRPLQAETYERMEDKYLVPSEYRDELLELLYHKSRPSYPRPDTQFVGIESVYFESRHFQSFRDHFLSKTYRYKLRTRRYLPNGVRIERDTHLELKTKEGGTSRKFRFKIGAVEQERLDQQFPLRLSPSLLMMNPAIPCEELSRRLKHVSRLLTEDGLRPLCRVSYERRAFDRKGVRVTLDSQIRAELLRPLTAGEVFGNMPNVQESAREMALSFHPTNHLLLEIKHRGEVPAWLTEFTLARTAGPVGFSKYCYSVTDQLLKASRGELHASFH